MWILYQAGVVLALVLAGPYLLVKRGRHYLETFPGRLGRYPLGAGRDPLWLHAVSVGEVGVAATLARAMPSDLPLLVTTVTPTGQERARAALAGRADVAYLPFELGFAVRRFFARFAPRALVLVEGDLWPLVLTAARRRGLPVVVVNGRVGEKSFRRMRRMRRLAGTLLGRVDRFGVQSEEDRSRLLALGVGAARVVVTGNLKYESPEPPPATELVDLLGAVAGRRPVLLAGSTMVGEEETVLAAFEHLGGGGRALLLLAPRHPERFDEVARLVERRGLRLLRRSGLAAPPSEAAADVVLLDSLGELAALYRFATVAFIGGTLVPTGGHNPLEAARFAVPVAVGPSMFNFADMADQFDRVAAWRRVCDAGELAAAWQEWLDDPAAAAAQGRRAADLVAANRGALGRTLSLLAPVLARAGAVGAGG
jgi:3-deoxy-D-manno-octulosonic-acid transferase